MRTKIHYLNDDEVLTTYASLAATPSYSLGDIAKCNHNGIIGQFRLSKNTSGGALAAGNVLTMPDMSTANFRSATTVYATAGASASGKTELTLNSANVAVGVAENQYAGCVAAITVGTGIKQFAQIVGNAAATTSQKLKLFLAKDFATALAADGTDDVQIILADYCEKTGTSILEQVSGICPVAVADGAYFWRQVSGLAFITVTDSTTVVAADSKLINASTTAGEALISAGANVGLENPFGMIFAKVGAGNTPALVMFRTYFAI